MILTWRRGTKHVRKMFMALNRKGTELWLKLKVNDTKTFYMSSCSLCISVWNLRALKKYYVGCGWCWHVSHVIFFKQNNLMSSLFLAFLFFTALLLELTFYLSFIRKNSSAAIEWSFQETLKKDVFPKMKFESGTSDKQAWECGS